MTASHKDLLITTFEEFNTAQRQANKARSDMHCIIATLPDEEKPAVADALPMPHRDRPIVAGDQRGENNEKQMSYVLSEYSARRRNRPLLVVHPQPEVIDFEPQTEPIARKKTKNTRGKRTNETDIRRAVKLFVDSANTDSPLTQNQAEKAAGIPQGALSKGKGKEILDDCMKDVSRISPRITVPAGVRRKAVEDATIYDDLR